VVIAGALALLGPHVASQTAPAPGRTTSKPAATPSVGAAKSNPPATPQQQRALQSEQQELRNELAKLKRQLAASEASQSEATDALASSEAAISSVNRRLRELAATRARIEQQMTALAAREHDVARRQGSQEEQLKWLMRELHVLSLRDPLQLLIEDGDPGKLDREAEYLGYLGRATSRNLQALGDRRAELAALQEESQQKRDELVKIAEDEQRNRALLQKEGERRRQVLAQLARQISTQRQSIARAERDEKRLAALIDSISKVLAERARREAERARQEAERRRQAKTPQKTSPATEPARPSASTSKEPQSSQNGSNFAQRKGHLALPVSGTVVARFGTPRRGEGGAGGPTWKGIFLQAPVGTDVRAVGDGTIVFSDWLRGFGNLMVIDHGDGFLSVYGNNESLLRNIGDKVTVGDVVASVGNTGGNEYPGLYFELRFQGRPFDPLTWVAAR
jgi:septal ring factor EnvC (AmiA/AmiB activator)